MSENTGQRREEEIFQKALQLTSEEARIGFLKGACGEDQELYARLVDLLHTHSVEENFIETVNNEEGVTFVDSPISEGPGTVIGRYKLLQQIGEGGMGVAYMNQYRSRESDEPLRSHRPPSLGICPRLALRRDQENYQRMNGWEVTRTFCM